MIDILLATYNGERHLPALLESVFAQSEQDFILHVLDDGSTDSTREILAAGAAARPGQLRLLDSSGHTGDPAQNFFRLLAQSGGDYCMFCDQDDVWLPDKVRLTLREMQRLEAAQPQVPVLVHTDLRVVNEDLAVISPSFMRYQNLDPQFRSLPRLVVQNNVTGCTILLNRALRECVRVPASAPMHDWWLALTASALGMVGYVPQATVLYRQHGGNTVGAQNARSLRHIWSRLRSGAVPDSMMRTYVLAAEFLRTYGDALSASQRTFLEQYAACGGSWWLRLRTFSRYGAYKKGLGRKLAQIFLG